MVRQTLSSVSSVLAFVSAWLTVLGGSLSCGGNAAAQTLQENFWVTDGPVNAIARSGNTVYVGGTFSRVGPATGNGVPFDVRTGEPLPEFPKIAGIVRVIVPDGSGGWYIGGLFTAVGGIPRSSLAHLRSDLTLSPWNPGAPLGVTAIAPAGATVYVGGDFTTIGGQDRARLAAVDAETGQVLSWNPGANGNVNSLATSGSTVYVGGYFRAAGRQSRHNLAALDATSGEALDWHADTDMPVFALLLSGGVLYVGGNFSTIGGQSRTGLAALDATTGQITPWQAGANRAVYDLLLNGSTLYASGDFTSIGGQQRTRLAALDVVTGHATAWDPKPNDTVFGLAVSGSTVYAAGSFTVIGGQPRSYLAALDATAGQATQWDPPAPNRMALALATSGAVLYVGGHFWSMGGQPRNGLAAFDAESGEATEWDPGPRGSYTSISTLAVSGSTVYVGGYFSEIGGQPRNDLAALDARTGQVTAWDPHLSGGFPNVLATSGRTVYVGGYFTRIGGQTRTSLAALDATSGLATDWDPGLECSWCVGDDLGVGAISDLEVGGGNLYVSGAFTGIGGEQRSGLAALDRNTGRATAWNPDPQTFVDDLCVAGSTVYVGGLFTTIGGQARNHLASVDARTGVATPWNPNPSGRISAIAVAGPTVYVGGEFSQIGGQDRFGVAAVSSLSGATTGWGANGALPNTIVASQGAIYVGGNFGTIDNLPRNGLAAFRAGTVVHSEANALSAGGQDAIAAGARPMSGTIADSPEWAPMSPQGSLPSPRWDHSAIFDPLHDQMVMFGGFLSGFLGPRSNETWTLGLNGIATWTQLALGTSPSARAGHTAIHDPLRDRMILFGGDDGPVSGSSVRNDTWALDLSGAPAWQQLVPSGTPPGARAAHTAIYDVAHDRIVVFGGTSGAFLNDVWALELSGTPTWVQLQPQGTPPAGRYGHSAVYDPSHQRMVVFGGISGASAYRNDVWALTLDDNPNWTQLSPSGVLPGPRSGQTAIYDAAGHDMIIFGGSAPSRLNDTWHLNLDGSTTWTQLFPSGALPAGRARHSAVYKPSQDTMVVFGGSTTGNVNVNDVWSLAPMPSTSVGTEPAPMSGLRLVGPNPLRVENGIRFAYEVPQPGGRVSIRLVDLMGRIVATPFEGIVGPGSHQGHCAGSDLKQLAPGVYFLHLQAEGQVSKVKLVLLK